MLRQFWVEPATEASQSIAHIPFVALPMRIGRLHLLQFCSVTDKDGQKQASERSRRRPPGPGRKPTDDKEEEAM